MKKAEDFENFYENTIKHELIGLDRKRKSFLNKFILWTLVFLSLIAYCFYFHSPYLCALLVLVAFFIAYNRLAKFRASFASKYKKEVIVRLVKHISKELNFEAKEGITKKDFQKSHLFNAKIERYNSEDLIFGTLEKTPIRIAEIHAEGLSEDGEGSKTHVDIFRGMFLIASFNKRTSFRTVVVPDLFQDKLGGVGRLLQKKIVWGGSDPIVKMENSTFEKHFAVYSSDQVEARYILSPILMERIIEFRMKHGMFWMSFIEGKLFLGIPKKNNLFEPNVFKSSVDLKLVKNYFESILQLVEIVETFDLNKRIWTEQEEDVQEENIEN